LELEKDISTWIKDRIKKYGFTENQDYVCSPVLVSKAGNQDYVCVTFQGSEAGNQDYVSCSTKRASSSGAKHAIDYHLTLDMAKELSMATLGGNSNTTNQRYLRTKRGNNGGT